MRLFELFLTVSSKESGLPGGCNGPGKPWGGEPGKPWGGEPVRGSVPPGAPTCALAFGVTEISPAIRNAATQRTMARFRCMLMRVPRGRAGSRTAPGKPGEERPTRFQWHHRLDQSDKSQSDLQVG